MIYHVTWLPSRNNTLLLTILITCCVCRTSSSTEWTRRCTNPTSSTSPLRPAPIRHRTLSCQNSTSAARACSAHHSARRLYVSHNAPLSGIRTERNQTRGVSIVNLTRRYLTTALAVIYTIILFDNRFGGLLSVSCYLGLGFDDSLITH